MHTVMVHNNAFDCILLTDYKGTVVSAWDATKQIIINYTRIPAKNWQVGQWPLGFNPDTDYDEDEIEAAHDLHTIAAYGEEVGRDGAMSDERRKFWFPEESHSPASKE